MNSWVYLFSRFTPELLLFEALMICVLIAGYAAFYILRRRRLGHVNQTVPSGLVKVYLNDLIQDAERMRAQLFGLLQNSNDPALQQFAAGANSAALMAHLAGAGGVGDPALLAQLQALQARMGEQNLSLTQLTTEKERLEAELAKLRTSGAPAGEAGGAIGAEVNDLKSKIDTLEGRLAEYSIIEDDLANLKRLQQENAQLRAALEKGGAAPAVAAAPAAEVAPPAPAAVAVATPATPDALQPDFEALVDQVEASIKQAAPAVEAVATPIEIPPVVETAPAPNVAVAAAAPPPAASQPMEKSDADLVAEFEKMLNS